MNILLIPKNVMMDSRCTRNSSARRYRAGGRSWLNLKASEVNWFVADFVLHCSGSADEILGG